MYHRHPDGKRHHGGECVRRRDFRDDRSVPAHARGHHVAGLRGRERRKNDCYARFHGRKPKGDTHAPGDERHEEQSVDARRRNERHMGAEVFRIGTSPNGLNINDHCGSLYPETLVAKVREVRADVGLALDGDADRLIVVDEKGNVLDGDQIMAMCAGAMMARGELPHKMLVATVMSNMALEIFMKERGGTLLRTKVGDRYVMEAMRRENAMLGGEQSGHLIFRQYSTTGDGLLAALQLLRIMREKDRPLSELAGLLRLFPQKLVNVRVEKKLPFEERPAIGEAVRKIEEELGERGRVLLRYSGTESLCRIMIEAENEDKVARYAEDLAEVVVRELR